VVSGVPRFSELLNTTKDSKANSCTVYFRDKIQTIEGIRKISRVLQATCFRDYVKESVVEAYIPKSWHEMYTPTDVQYDMCITFHLNMEMLYRHRQTPANLAMCIEEIYGDVLCIPSPPYMALLDVLVDTNNFQPTKCHTQHVVYCESVIVPNLYTVHISGISGITNVFFQKSAEEWFVETEGSNLERVFALSCVDFRRTFCNNMWEIYSTLGVEATRQFLINEFMKVVGDDGTSIDKRHVMLLVDTMTHSGSIISISRYGMRGKVSGPLAKASFEESIDNFIRAGIHGEVETTNGISSAIVCGNTSCIGTGLCEIILDMDNLSCENENEGEMALTDL
jgi:hypothetical protein